MGVTFNGTNQIDVAGWGVPTGNIAFSFWVRFNTVSGTQRPFGSDNLMEIRLVGTSMFNDIYSTAGPASSTVFAAGTLYHIVAQGTPAAVSSFYVDGVLDSSGTTTPSTPTGTTLSLGTRQGSTQRLNGDMWDFRVYDRLLTATEIAMIFATRGADDIRDYRNRWLLNEGAPGATVGTVIDLATNNNGTGVTSPVYTDDSILKLRRRVA